MGLRKRFRYWAKHHDSETGEYVYPGSLPPPQRVSKTRLSYQVKMDCTGPLRTKLCLLPIIWYKGLYGKQRYQKLSSELFIEFLIQIYSLKTCKYQFFSLRKILSVNCIPYMTI